MEFKPTNLISVDLTSANPTSILIAGYLTPPQIAKAYGLPNSTGKGIKIGILSFGGGFLQSDLDKSFADFVAAGWFPAGTKAPTIKQVLLDGQTGQFSMNDGSSGENTVDIYCTATIVPEADITLYIGYSWDTVFNRAVADGCHFISVSWATLEDAWPYVEPALNNATANKVTVCVASGDWGSSFPGYTTGLHPCYPSSSPNAVSIGGTKLTLNNDSTRKTETDDNRNPSFGPTWGGGGGVSAVFSLPTWQNNLHYTPITNGVLGTPQPLTMRGLPDISAPMNLYAVYFGGYTYGFGGTSLACPVIVGMLARIQQLTGRQLSSAEYNQIFYANPGTFYDIVVGTNNTLTNDGYAGTADWDPVTGLGPPKWQDLYTVMRKGTVFPKKNYSFRQRTGVTYPRVSARPNK